MDSIKSMDHSSIIYDFKSSKKLEKQENKKKNKLAKEINMINKIEEEKIKLLNSDIDFTKFGWVNKAAILLDKLPQKISCWMKKNLPVFYEKNCYRKKVKNKCII